MQLAAGLDNAYFSVTTADAVYGVQRAFPGDGGFQRCFGSGKVFGQQACSPGIEQWIREGWRNPKNREHGSVPGQRIAARFIIPRPHAGYFPGKGEP